MSEPSDTQFFERFWQTSDGLTLFSRDYPAASGTAKRPVICIHGLTRNSADFAQIAPAIAASGRRVLSVDVRGRGRSERASDPLTYDVPTYARDILGLLGDLGLSDAVFLGTSMGGLISLAIANKRPSACHGIILNDVGPEVDQRGIDRIKSYAGKSGSFANWQEAGHAMKAVGGVSFPEFSDEDWITFAKMNHVESEGEITVACDPGIAVNMERPLPPRFLRWLLFKRAARACEMLVIRGETSDILACDVADKMARVRNVELATVSGIGHAPMLTEPDAKAALFDFLGRIG